MFAQTKSPASSTLNSSSDSSDSAAVEPTHTDVDKIAADLEKQIQNQIPLETTQPSQNISRDVKLDHSQLGPNQSQQPVEQIVQPPSTSQLDPQSNQPTGVQPQPVQTLQDGALEQQADAAPASQPQPQISPEEFAVEESIKETISDEPIAPTQPTENEPQQPAAAGPKQAAVDDSQQTQHTFPGLLGVLFVNNVVDSKLAQEINTAHLNTGKSIEQLLEESQLVSEIELTKAKAELNNIPFIEVDETGISPEALNKINESVAKRYQVLPFAFDESAGRLKAAMVNPLNVTAISFIEQKTGYKLEAYYGVPSEISRLISERYAQDLSEDVSDALEETSALSAKKDQLLDQSQQGGFVRAAPINKIVSTILEYAVQSRASDVHIEPLTEKTRVRYRIDGILYERLILPKSVHSAVVSRIKILSTMKIDEKRIPQDGRFDYQAANNEEIDLRVSSCPGVHGEKIVMRLLKKNQAVPKLEELGLGGLALQRIQKAIRIPHGIFLISGPTGSGKTTSLYSILHIKNTNEVNIITLEDPVEYQMKGVTQVQVNPQAGLTFANGLRSFLRQDPDIIMVGEIRDAETAGLAVQASLTGHLVFSTLHTNSASGALPRLMDMNVEPFLLSSSMILAMGQRVVRRINPDYKEEYKPDPSVLKDIQQVLGRHLDNWCQKNNKDLQDITLCRPTQKRPHNEPAFKGRIGIFEVMDITDKIKNLINKQATTDEIQEQAMAEGMMLMKQDGYLKALDGITTIEEVLRVAEVIQE